MVNLLRHKAGTCSTTYMYRHLRRARTGWYYSVHRSHPFLGCKRQQHHVHISHKLLMSLPDGTRRINLLWHQRRTEDTPPNLGSSSAGLPQIHNGTNGALMACTRDYLLAWGGQPDPPALGRCLHLPEQVLEHLPHRRLPAFTEVPELGHHVPPTGVVLVYLHQRRLHRVAHLIAMHNPQVLQFRIIVI